MVCLGCVSNTLDLHSSISTPSNLALFLGYFLVFFYFLICTVVYMKVLVNITGSSYDYAWPIFQYITQHFYELHHYATQELHSTIF